MTGLARWRLELAIILAILAAHHYGTQRIPDPWTTILILAAITGLIAWPRTRAVVTNGLWHARVRRAWTRAVIDTGAADPPPGRSRRPTSRYGPKAGRIHDVLAGEQLTVRIPRGDSVTTLEQRHDALAACLQVKEVRIAREGDNARHCRALLVRRDPFDLLQEVPWPNQHAATTSLIWERIPIGVDENGQPVTLDLSDANGVLVGGVSGSGKSVAVSILVATGALDNTVDLWLADGKGEVEFTAWSPVAKQSVGRDRAAAISMLREVRTVMEANYAELKRLGKRKIEPGMGLRVQFIVIDELAFFLNPDADDKKGVELAKTFSRVLRGLISEGRAAGIRILAATQKPSTDVIPSSLRDMFAYALALRCRTPQASDTILGQGWASEGADASKIPDNQRGAGHLLAEGARPERVKGYLLDDEGVSQIASRATGRHAEAWLAGTGGPATDTGLEQSDGTGGNTAPEKPASSPEPGDAGGAP
jgi:hypothetical protein